MNSMKILNNEWVDRSYILNEYPLSHKTYNNRVKLLDNEIYSGCTFIGKYGKRFINKSILDTIFLSHRIPNRNQPNQIRKWVKLHNWNYFGNIIPLCSDIDTNQELINRIFKLIKQEYQDLILFYSVEQNPNSNNLYHTHFLIKTEDHIKIKEIISQIKHDTLLKEFINPNEIKTNSRIQIEEYNHELFTNRGLNYVLNYNIKIGLLK